MTILALYLELNKKGSSTCYKSSTYAESANFSENGPENRLDWETQFWLKEKP